MTGGRADTVDQRAAVLGGIRHRNRVVGALRFIVPALGVGAFVFLAGQIYIAGLARQYGVAGIRIDRGTVVVEAPQYSGTGSDGSRYLVTAREARTPLERSEEIEMMDATLELLDGGVTYFSTAKTAHLNSRRETVRVPGLVNVTGSDGLVGTLNEVDVDSRRELVTSNGPVDLLMSDGTIILGSTMVRDGKTQTYTFTNATVIVPDLPKAEPGAPDAIELELREAMQ